MVPRYWASSEVIWSYIQVFMTAVHEEERPRRWPGRTRRRTCGCGSHTHGREELVWKIGCPGVSPLDRRSRARLWWVTMDDGRFCAAAPSYSGSGLGVQLPVGSWASTTEGSWQGAS